MNDLQLTPRIAGLPNKPTLARFLDFWLAHVAWGSLRFATARTYSSVVVHLITPTLGDLQVVGLRPAHVARAEVLWAQAGVTIWMRRKAIEVLRSALNHAVLLGLCEVNVAQRARLPGKRERAPAWLEIKAVKQLLADARGHQLEPVYALGACLGLRRGEIAGLTWADVDLPRARLTVNWNRVEWEHGTRLMAPKTAAARRTLALPTVVLEVLRRHRARELRKAERHGVSLLATDPVLTTRTRRPFSVGYLYVDFKMRLRRLGLPSIRFHDLRHTAASLMLAEGISPRTVMEMMGHKNLAVTMLVYGHSNLDQQRRAVATLDRALRRRKIY